MRVYTKVVWEWRGDELVQVEAESYEYEGPVDYAKGGGSDGPENYENLERLYGIQADQAEFLGQTFKGTVAPAYKGWLQEAQDYGSIANQEQAAERAGKAVSGASGQQRAAMEANLASMGINPADERYAQGMKEMGVQAGAQQAAAETGARENVRNQGFARTQDAISMGMGTPTQASQAANAAANTANISLQNQTQQQQNQANSVGNIVRAGTNIWGAYNDPSGGFSMKADGGQVQKNGILRLKGGGYVQRLAPGGKVGMGGGGGGFMAMPSVPAPPPMNARPPAPTGIEQGAAAATSPLGLSAMKQGVGKAAELGGNAAGSPYMESLGRGLQLSPGQAREAANAYKAADTTATQASNEATYLKAQQAVDNAMGQGTGPVQQMGGHGMENFAAAASQDAALDATGQVATDAVGQIAAEEAGTVAAEQAAALAAEEAAAATAAEGLAIGGAEAGAGLAAGAALGTAVPVIGGGLALYGIGNAAGWWADGGQVQPGGPPQEHDERWKMADPYYGIREIGRKNNWWADGGAVTPGSQQQTGEVDGPGGPKDDEVLAALSDGEFVMPVGAVKFFGIDRLEKMRQKGLEHEKTLGIA